MSVVNKVSDVFADLVSGTVGPIAAAGASLAEQAFTDNTVEELEANNKKYNEFLNYAPRTEFGKSVNEGAMEAIGEGAAAVGEFYTKHEDKIPDAVKSSVGAVSDTWNDLDESTRFALGNLATVGEVVPIGKVAGLLKRGSKLAPEDVMPDGVPVKDPMQPAPELQQNSALRLPAARTAMTPNVDELGYTSGIEEEIIKIIQSREGKKKAPTEIPANQLLDMLKSGGSVVKADELEWTTFSDYLEGLGKTKIPLDEALRQAKNRSITLEVIEVPNPKNSTFHKFNTVGGENYRELLFEFNTDTEGLEKSIIDLKDNERPKLEEEYRSLQKDRARLLAPRLNDMQFQQRRYYRELNNNSDIDAVRNRSDELDWLLETTADMELDVTPRAAEVTQRLLEISRELTRKRAELKAITFNAGHHKNDQNIVFHTRITDRNIGGGKSLAIDEIQSDWHKTNKDKPVQNRYYRLPEAELVKKVEDNIEKAELLYEDAKAAADLDRDIIESSLVKDYGDLEITSVAEAYELGLSLKEARKFKGADRNKLILLKTIFPSKEELDGYYDRLLAEQKTADTLKFQEEYLLKLDRFKDIDKRNGTNVAYKKWTRALKPNAPLKNREKWMAAALNAMLFKAVKEGYDSVSWPNGRSQVVRYWGNDSSRTVDAHNKIRQEALSSIYDVAVPTALQKMAKKMDKNAKIEFGKQSKDSNPRPIPKDGWAPDFDIAKNDYEHYKKSGNNGAYGKRLKFPEFKEKYFSGTDDAAGSYFDANNSAYSHIKITPAMKEAILKGKALFNKGGLVENEMEAMSFAEGGLPERTVPYGNSTNPSDQLGDIEFRADMDDWLSWNAVARLGYDPKKSKIVNDSKHIPRIAQYIPPIPQGKDEEPFKVSLEEKYANKMMADEDLSRINHDNVVLTGNMADQPVWSHEFTHRGFNELREYLKRDPKKFLFKYGQEAFDALNSSKSWTEGIVETYDDHSIKEPKETPTYLQMKDAVDWVKQDEADGIIPDPQHIIDDASTRESVKSTLSSINTVEGMDAYDKDNSDMKRITGYNHKPANLQVQLHKAATDLLRERGEPVREDQKKGWKRSIMDDLSESAIDTVFNLFN